jgi:DNA-binding NarL/FixJ family response regulator
MTELSVMLVDDHAIVRAGFRRLLEQQSGLRVVAEAASGEEAYRRYGECSPDVLILDLSMPDMSGLEVLRRIVQRKPSARILVFSMHEDATLAQRAMQLGARGYVTKSAAPEVLVKAVAEIAAGRIFLGPDIAHALAVFSLAGEESPLQRLGAREFEIYRLLVGGRSVTDIAQVLNLSVKTVANYHTQIKQKLNVASDIELVLLAQRPGRS